MMRRAAQIALVATLVVVACSVATSARADAPPENPPIVDIYTMGPGEELFTRFGHAAICVTDALSPVGRCYNYGTADFSTPGPLTVGIVRGNALFWVSVVAQPRMLAWYQRQDRTVYRQRLPYDPEITPWLVAALHKADVRSATFYNYHHFRDNCTTRIRDLLDNATHHSLGLQARAIADPPLRHYVDAGLAGRPLLIAVSDLFLGRPLDRPGTRWQSMFLPEILRDEVKARFHAQPEVLYRRIAPLSEERASPHAGSQLLVAIGVLLALTTLFFGWRNMPRIGLIPTALVLGLIGFFLTTLVLFSPLAELRYNEALLLCWPTDLALPFLPLRLAGRYAALRLAMLALAAMLALCGVLIQPLWGAILLCALPLFAAVFVSRAVWR